MKYLYKCIVAIFLLCLFSCTDEKFSNIQTGDYVFVVGSEFRGGALVSENYFEVFKISKIKDDWVILVPLRFFVVQDEFKYDFYKKYEKLNPEQKFQYLETHFGEVTIQSLTYKYKNLIDSHAYVSGDMDFIPDLHIDKYPLFKKSPFAVVDYTPDEKDTLKFIEKDFTLPYRKMVKVSELPIFPVETKFTKLSEMKTGKLFFYEYQINYKNNKLELISAKNRKFITKIIHK